MILELIQFRTVELGVADDAPRRVDERDPVLGLASQPVGQQVLVDASRPLAGDEAGFGREPCRRFRRQATGELAVDGNRHEEHERADHTKRAEQEAMREFHVSRGACNR